MTDDSNIPPSVGLGLQPTVVGSARVALDRFWVVQRFTRPSRKVSKNIRGTGTTKILPKRQAVKFKPPGVFKTAVYAV